MIDLDPIKAHLKAMHSSSIVDVAPMRTQVIAALVNELERVQPVLDAALNVEQADFLDRTEAKFEHTTAATTVFRLIKTVRATYQLPGPPKP